MRSSFNIQLILGCVFLVGLAVGLFFPRFSESPQHAVSLPEQHAKAERVSLVDRVENIELPSLNANGFLARVFLDSPEELEKAFRRAEMLFEQGGIKSADKPITFIIHGPEVEVFLKENYRRYQSLVDLSAKLSAFGVVDVSVCRTRLGILNEGADELPPFVSTVPYGPAEIDRLLGEQKYVHF